MKARSTAVISIMAACFFVALFKVSATWPVIGGSMHLILFWPPMLILIFLTSFRAVRKVNNYVAEHITDHPFIRRVAEKPIASFLVAASLSVTLSLSMAIFTYTMSWSAFPIVVGGFVVVAGLIHALSFRDYLKSAVAEVSRGYVAVGAASFLMILAYLVKSVLWDFPDLDPLSPELIELVRGAVEHPNYAFESVARTVVFLNVNVLSLGNIEGLTRSLVVMLLLLTTSAVPFVSLALFMRSLYEVIWNVTTHRDPTRRTDGQIPLITGINHVTFSVKELHSSIAFYRDVLGMTLHVIWDTGAYLTAGDTWICLSAGKPAPARDYTHVAFSVDSAGLAEMRTRLQDAGAEEWQTDTSEGESLYFLDPDGHRLELHCGTLASRLADLKKSPYKGLVYAEGLQ